jgi:adenosylhomocysteinase
MSDDTLRVRGELSRIDAFFPVLAALGNRWAAARPWDGLTVALNLHLTTLTLALVRELVLGGGRWVVNAANPATTDPGVVTALRELGVEVWTGRAREDGLDAVVKARPLLFGDVGFALGDALLRDEQRPRGGVEITRSGVSRLRAIADLPFPVLNINDGRLKPAIENRHGVGEGLWQAFTALTGCHVAGRRVLVVGYGPVGAGVAAYARAGGASVEVVELSAIGRLAAHYDGFPVPALGPALARCQIVVTATGAQRVIGRDALARLADGAILLNAGHGPDEIAVGDLARGAASVDHVGPHVVRYRTEAGRTLTVLAAGNPLNIVMNSGSHEPVLLHFAVLGLGLQWLAEHDLPPGESLVPAELEEQAAEAALGALG